MKSLFIFQKLMPYTIWTISGVVLVLLVFGIFCRFKQISIDCTNLSEIKLLRLGRLKTALTLKLTPCTAEEKKAEIFYAGFDKNLSGSIWKSTKNTFHITVRGRTFWGKYHVPYNISGNTAVIRKLFNKLTIKAHEDISEENIKKHEFW